MTSRPSSRTRLARGECLDAIWLSLGNAAIAEIAARGCPGVVVIDMQHGLWDRGSLEAAVGLATPHAPVVVRVADSSPVAISQALDAGAEGILAPLIETSEQAAAVVAASRFPPLGARSGGGVRPLRDFVAYVAEANTSTLVGVMIETRAGVERASEIAAVPGVDLVFIGTGDLGLSLGEFPAPGPAHAAACAAILAACAARGMPCGAFTGSVEAARRRREEGYRFVVTANDIDVVQSGFAGATRGFGSSRDV